MTGVVGGIDDRGKAPIGDLANFGTGPYAIEDFYELEVYPSEMAGMVHNAKPVAFHQTPGCGLGRGGISYRAVKVVDVIASGHAVPCTVCCRDGDSVMYGYLALRWPEIRLAWLKEHREHGGQPC